ncbi:MAG: DNA mismatch repair protein MutS [Sphingobacteriales bacterium]|nr:MAG: DNA mismatch repair protein MutS [Sphingobacteriales bacterium]
MVNDRITLKDLSVFTAESGGGVFALLDHTTTQAGRDQVRAHIQHPPDTYEQLQEMQDAIRFWADNGNLWPEVISNGTLVMLEKFFEAADNVSAPPSSLNLLFGPFLQKILNKTDYFFTQFSLSHLSDLLKGCTQLAAIPESHEVPPLLQRELEAIKEELKHRLTPELLAINKNTPYRELATLNFKARREIKNTTYRLMKHYARLDAWQSLARATQKNNWIFPQLSAPLPASFEAKGLHHPLLTHPVSYDISFNEHQNFLLLTGANMSGKTTFMRALGVGALLAHLGVGVPAQSFRISFLQGIITNMHVEDNILKGESYFLAEVKRMKQTATKLQEPLPHLVLMDELFKGTNVHDAYECTRAVVEGLLNRPHHLMVLSTHLYEVAQHFANRKDILFAYFVTDTAPDNTYRFRYELKEGISNDRIGYRILQQEGVIDLLKKHD